MTATESIQRYPLGPEMSFLSVRSFTLSWLMMEKPRSTRHAPDARHSPGGCPVDHVRSVADNGIAGLAVPLTAQL